MKHIVLRAIKVPASDYYMDLICILCYLLFMLVYIVIVNLLVK